MIFSFMTNNSLNMISTSSNKTFKYLLEISKGKIANMILCEGEDLLSESYQSNNLLKIIFYEENEIVDKYKDVEKIKLSKQLYRELSNYQSLPKVMGISKLNLSSDNFGNKVVYLDNLQDGGNVGTIIRSALAFDFDSVVLSSDCISIFSKKVIQASKGAIFKMKLGIQPLENFVDKYNIYSTTLDGEDEKNFEKLKKPFVLVLGNEGHGIRKSYQDISKKIKIDIKNIDSLNVAIAGSIFMYRFKD